VDALGIVQGSRVEISPVVVEEHTREADQVPQRCAQVVRHRVQQGLDLGRRRPERGALIREPPFQLAGLASELLPETGVLNGDGQRSCDLEGDVPVLGIEGRGSGRSEVDLPDDLAFDHERGG
jgi:hypothetical protein